MMHISLVTLLNFAILLCFQVKTPNSKMIDRANFKKTVNGKQVDLYTLKNNQGMIVQITNYGGKVVSLIVPDGNGNFDDVVTGYDNIGDYQKGDNSFGATIGRFGNRIANGKFTLEGKEYTLAQNNGKNHLHGGIKNFSNSVWDVVDDETSDQKLTITYLSEDGEEGYPGNLDVRVVYTVTDKNELIIDYYASTDKTTVINLTNHSYFNLEGGSFEPVYDHELQIPASHFVASDEELIPSGEIWEVKDTPMDFNTSTPIGSRINKDYAALINGGGYDVTYVLDNESGELVKCGEVYAPKTGRLLECWTSEPGVHLYTSGHFNGSQVGKNGVVYKKHGAFCLETQHYPNSPNIPQFPSTTLTPDDMYKSTTVFKFGTR